MNGELVPAVLAAGGGGAMLAGIAAYEHRQAAQMRSTRRAFSLTFPIGASEAMAAAALSSLAGLDARGELVMEVVADSSGIKHLLHVPEAAAESVTGQLAAALPGLRLDAVQPRSTGAIDVAVRMSAGSRALLRTEDVAAGSRALLSGLAALVDGERVSLRWALRPGSSAPEVTTAKSSEVTSLAARAQRRALQLRTGEPGFGVRGLLLVRAGTPGRSKRLAEHVLTALRSRRGIGPGLTFRRGRASMASMPQTGRGQSWLTTAELMPLLGWPLGDELVSGVTVGAARRLLAGRGVPRVGRTLMMGRDAYGERPVALCPEAALHHLAVAGSSGVGKSVLLARGALDQIASGAGGVVIDAKGPDLVNLILDRVSKQDAERIVVLDPAARGAVPGLNLLGSGDPDLRADVIVGVLSKIFAGSWGVRSDYYVRLAVRTIAEVPGATLTDAGLLLVDTGYRRGVLRHLSDAFTRSAWQAFEALGPAEQAQHVQAPVARMMGLLSRPTVRAVLASPEPKIDIARLLAERKWLLVSLSPGTLGEPATRLLSSVVMYLVWNAIEGRSALPAADRAPVWITIDELATLADLPISFELLGERSRGLGAGLTVAFQTLGRLPEGLRASLLGNVASLVSFRAGHLEATRLAAELPGLTASDLMALGRFEVAARIGTGVGSSTTVATGHTQPLGAPAGYASWIRQRSSERYGPTIDPLLRGHAPSEPEERFGRAGGTR